MIQSINERGVIVGGSADTEEDLATTPYVPLWEINMGQVGAKGYDEVHIYLRVRDRPEPAFFSQVYEPNPGFLILGTEVIVRGRLGDTEGPFTILVQSNSATDTLQLTELYRRQFLDFANSIQGKIQKDSKSLEILSDIKQRFENEFKSIESLRRTYSSSNRGVRLEAKARAVKDWWGIYKSGGLVDAVVKIYQVYVGSPAYLDTVVDKYSAEVADLAKRVIEPRPAQPVSISAVADTYVRADFNLRKNDNYGLTRVMNVGTGRGSSVGAIGAADAMRSLIRFDLAGLPATIDKAVLELTVHSFGGSTASPYRIGVYAVTQPWQEGNGAEGYAELVTGATDPDSAAGVAWEASDKNNQAQPSSEPQPVAEITIDPQTTKPGNLVSWDITALVARWLKDPRSNYGLMLRDLTTAGEFRELRFGTREADMFMFPDGVRGPRLVIQPR